MWFCFLENIAAIWGLITATSIILSYYYLPSPAIRFYCCFILPSQTVHMFPRVKMMMLTGLWTKRDGSNWIHPSHMEPPSSSHPRLPRSTVSVLTLLDWARTCSLSMWHMKVVRPSTIKTKYSTDPIRARLEQRSEACQHAGCVSHD